MTTPSERHIVTTIEEEQQRRQEASRLARHHRRIIRHKRYLSRRANLSDFQIQSIREHNLHSVHNFRSREREMERQLNFHELIEALWNNNPTTPQLHFIRQHQLQRRIAQDAALTGLYSLEEFVDDAVPPQHILPPMDSTCSYCHAFLYPSEVSGGRICCCKGKVVLAPMTPLPTELHQLFIRRDVFAQDFRKNIRAYNSAFAFTSLGVKLDHNLASSRDGVYTFCIQGEMYHRIGSILPPDNVTPVR